MITRFRKRPVEVEAIRWTGDNADEVKAFVGLRDNGESRFLLPSEITGVWDHAHVYDELHDTWVTVYIGQWVVKGVRGEFYPIAEDVLAETYEPVTAWGSTPLTACGHPEDHRCFDCATDEELAAWIPPPPWEGR